MAHKLNFKSNGVASFASKQEPAWHGLGTVVDAMTSKEAIELGGLNFEVELRPLYTSSIVRLDPPAFQNHTGIARTFRIESRYEGEHGERKVQVKVPIYNPLLVIPDKYATIRTDTNIPLGIVGSRYHVIQNFEAFDFIDSIIGEGKADYETVGALGNGETIFITCKLKEELVINKDLIDKYLLLTMSHDGSSSITVMFTPIRVVCNNTLSCALKGIKNKVTIRHTANAKHKLELAKDILGIVDQQTLAYKEAFGILASIKVPDEQVETILAKCLSVPFDKDGKVSTRSFNTLTNLKDYYFNGLGQDNIVGTGWGIYNGVTGYLQNVKEYKSEEVKFSNTFMGTSNDIRDTTISTLLRL